MVDDGGINNVWVFRRRSIALLCEKNHKIGVLRSANLSHAGGRKPSGVQEIAFE